MHYQAQLVPNYLLHTNNLREKCCQARMLVVYKSLTRIWPFRVFRTFLPRYVAARTIN